MVCGVCMQRCGVVGSGGANSERVGRFGRSLGVVGRIGRSRAYLDVVDTFTPEGGFGTSTPEGGAEQTNMGALTCVLWAFAHIPRRGVETC